LVNDVKRPFRNKQEYTRIFIKKVIFLILIYSVFLYYNVVVKNEDIMIVLFGCGVGIIIFLFAFILKEGVPMDEKDIEILMYEQEILEKSPKK
jgi:hypothetical protein